jgi:hypothetical protein
VILTFLLLPVKTGIVFTGCFVVSFTLLSLKVQCAKQKTALSLLQDKLQKERNIKTPLPQSEHNGFVFTEVGGVTVRIGSNGGIDIPAVRTYREHPSDAAAIADILFRKQHERDEDDPARARGFETGHLSPRVNFAGRCEEKACRCNSRTS